MPQLLQEIFTSSYLGKNYSLQGVKQEVACVVVACLFGFHVSMATGTYGTSHALSVHKMHTVYHYCIPQNFYS